MIVFFRFIKIEEEFGQACMSEEAETSDDSPKFCSNCGSPLRPKVKFCTVCGYNIENDNVVEPEIIPKEDVPQGPPVYPTQPINPQPDPNQPNPSQQYPYYPNTPQNAYQPNQGFTQAPPYGYNPNYGSKPMDQQSGARGVSSSSIKPVTGKFMTRDEMKISLGFGLTALFSHFVRYIIIYNRVPDLLNFLYPIPFYLALGFIILGANKYFMRNKGVDIEFEADNYDYMVSSVFSSFFLSLMNYRFKFKPETSNVPDIVYHPQNSKQGMQYLELSKRKYVGIFVRPRAFFNLIMFTTALSIICLWWYFQDPFSNLGLVVRFMAMYLGGYGLSHVSPRVGRVNEEMSLVGRYRTLLLFLISAFVFVVSLIGNQFFSVL